MLVLLYVIQKDLLWSKAWHVNEFKFGRSTPRSASRSNPLLLTSCGQEWQLADLLADLLPSIDISWSRMAISRSASRSTPQYWHLVVQNGSFTLLLTSSGQEWQLADLLADLHPPNASWDIYYGMYLAAILDSSRKGGNFLLFLNN